MADIITDLVADLTTKMQTISAISNKIIYMYEMDDLLTEQTKIGIPAIGVVYNSMRGKQQARAQGQTGLIAMVTMDIYILGGQQCVEKISRATGVKTTTTAFLEQIRDAIKLTKPQASGAVREQTQRVWTFVLEQPVILTEEVISYVQRWETTVALH